MRFSNGVQRTCTIALVLGIGLVFGCSGNDEDQIAQPSLDDPCQFPTGSPPATFSVSRPFINAGESTQLSWESLEADTVTIEPGIGPVELNGEREVSPAETTTYRLKSKLSDKDCNVLAQTVTVRPLAEVQIQANIVEGIAPLSVRFTPIVESRGSINRYYWDFEGDGGSVNDQPNSDDGSFDEAQGFDQVTVIDLNSRPTTVDYDVAGQDFTHIFEEPNTYTTRVRVYDLNGKSADAQIAITVTNAKPQGTVRAQPTTGQVPMLVRLEVVEASDNEGISLIEWDFDGDGTYDSRSEIDELQTLSSVSVDHLYEQVGEFRPRVRITDKLDALEVLDPLNLQVNAVVENVPKVEIGVPRNSGNAPLQIAFTSNINSLPNVQSFAWDFDGDGVTDNDSDASVDYVFNEIGTFYPTLIVTDADGNVGKDIVSISVVPDHKFTILNDAINPESGETSTVDIDVRGTGPLQVVVENESNSIVKTLMDWESQVDGKISLSWDGRNDEGEIPDPGWYYLVLRYKTGEGEETIDLRDSTGGEIFYPEDVSDQWGCFGNGLPNASECGTLEVIGLTQQGDNFSFDPYGGTPVRYVFTLPYNAKVSAYITGDGRNITDSYSEFFRSRLMAKGEHQIDWFAEGTDGKFLDAPSSRFGYVPAIFGIRASENTIALNHETRLSNFRLKPDIFFPASRSTVLGNTMTFDLSRQSDVLMRVDSIDAGTEIFRKTFPNVPAGQDITLSWDGRVNETDFASPGGYRIQLTALDRYGQKSLPITGIQRIRY